MTFYTKIKKDTPKALIKFYADPEFIKLEQFYKDALDKGFAKKAEYTLPPLDLMGRNLYRSGFNHVDPVAN